MIHKKCAYCDLDVTVKHYHDTNDTNTSGNRILHQQCHLEIDDLRSKLNSATTLAAVALKTVEWLKTGKPIEAGSFAHLELENALEEMKRWMIC